MKVENKLFLLSDHFTCARLLWFCVHLDRRSGSFGETSNVKVSWHLNYQQTYKLWLERRSKLLNVASLQISAQLDQRFSCDQPDTERDLMKEMKWKQVCTCLALR